VIFLIYICLIENRECFGTTTNSFRIKNDFDSTYLDIAQDTGRIVANPYVDKPSQLWKVVQSNTEEKEIMNVLNEQCLADYYIVPGKKVQPLTPSTTQCSGFMRANKWYIDANRRLLPQGMNLCLDRDPWSNNVILN